MSHATVHHPIFARVYARACPRLDRAGGAEHRDRLLADLAGRVVEVGAGTGANFAHYPDAVTHVTAVEPEDHLRHLAELHAATSPVPVTVVDGVAERLEAGDGSFDAGVVSLVLCSVRDVAAALAELHRVIVPGGELRFYEHVAHRSPRVRRVQRFLDATLWPKLTGGCHTSRQTAEAIEQAGFGIDRIERFRFPPRLPAPMSPHILGRATRLPAPPAD